MHLSHKPTAGFITCVICALRTLECFLNTPRKHRVSDVAWQFADEVFVSVIVCACPPSSLQQLKCLNDSLAKSACVCMKAQCDYQEHGFFVHLTCSYIWTLTEYIVASLSSVSNSFQIKELFVNGNHSITVLNRTSSTKAQFSQKKHK